MPRGTAPGARRRAAAGAAPKGRPRASPRLREGFVGQRRAEHLVVGPEVVDVDPRLRHAQCSRPSRRCRPAIGEKPWAPPAHRAAAQPLVLEEAEAVQVVVGLNSAPRVPVEPPGVLEPERRPRLRVKVPGDDLYVQASSPSRAALIFDSRPNSAFAPMFPPCFEVRVPQAIVANARAWCQASRPEYEGLSVP